jgi:octaprenyl-diphosphate synthase
LSRANTVERAALKKFGLAIGTAYQVYDDCLDLFGSEAKAGKSRGTDLAKGKLTLRSIIALERANEAGRKQFEALVGDWQRTYLPKAARWLHKHDALAASRQAVHDYLGVARGTIVSLCESESRAGLFGLTEYLAQQTDALAHHEIGL